MDNNLNRYNRQILLQELGLAGQEKLFATSVLVIGAGGLGCPCLQYLVAAGVGSIGIVDGDIVDISNLHRQILYNTNDIGKPKATTAKAKLHALNPGCSIEAFDFYLDNKNAFTLVNDYDIVVDGSDNFGTRYLVNDVCALLRKPLVYGAVQKFEGQVAVFNAGPAPVQYRDLFPEPPAAGAIPNCAEAGVIGVLPGIIGSMQANEVIKLVTGIGKPLINKMFTWNALNNLNYELDLQPDKSGSARPASFEAILQTDYNITCASQVTVNEIDAAGFDSFITGKNIVIIDVREPGELPSIDYFSHRKIPLSIITKNPAAIHLEEDTILFCQTGIRSRTAATLLKPHNTVNIYSLAGGIAAWLQPHTNLNN